MSMRNLWQFGPPVFLKATGLGPGGFQSTPPVENGMLISVAEVCAQDASYFFHNGQCFQWCCVFGSAFWYLPWTQIHQEQRQQIGCSSLQLEAIIAVVIWVTVPGQQMRHTSSRQPFWKAHYWNLDQRWGNPVFGVGIANRVLPLFRHIPSSSTKWAMDTRSSSRLRWVLPSLL